MGTQFCAIRCMFCRGLHYLIGPSRSSVVYSDFHASSKADMSTNWTTCLWLAAVTKHGSRCMMASSPSSVVCSNIHAVATADVSEDWTACTWLAAATTRGSAFVELHGASCAKPLVAAHKFDSRWENRCWLGVKSEMCEVVTGTSVGVVKSCDFKRFGSQSERWNKELVLSILGAPWKPVSGRTPNVIS